MKFFDLHCDTPYECFKSGKPFFDGDNAVNVQKGRVFDKWCQVCAVWIPDECSAPKVRYDAVVENFKSQADITVGVDGLTAENAFLLSLEGGAIIEKTEDVDRLFFDGVRVMSLTWNGKNALAGGVNTNAPLTSLGREVIERMNELGIALDVSHLNDRCFFDAVSLAKYVTATHSCCRSVHGVRRNLTDSQIKAVISKNGIIGICLYPRFLGEGDVFKNFLLHYSHIVSLGGGENVSVGSDFDGADMSPVLNSLDKLPSLYYYLINSGFDTESVDRLFYENAFRFFKELLK